ncbi:hypothetical protein E3P99_03262 [Wallemia hederae]|uniref:Phytochrome n=1 Tax=Wallemia hederae TaxID=1540922 RepID=A0A4T0FGK3_9BASI|nr:hypothetical protein E3P99_03262 [Wallemia hederae]
MGDSDREMVFPVRSVFNRTSSNFSQLTASSASHEPSAARDGQEQSADGDKEQEMSFTSGENNVSKDTIQEEDETEVAQDESPTQHPNSPTANHANFDRRKGTDQKVSSSVGQARTAPRGIDRNVHLSDPNEPLPEDMEEKTQQSSSTPTSGAEDSNGPTKEEEERRERDYVAGRMEEMGDSNSSESRSDESGTMKQPPTAAEAMERHKSKLNEAKNLNQQPTSIQLPDLAYDQSEGESSITSLADEDEPLPTTRRFQYHEENGEYYLVTHHNSKMKRCEDEPIGRPGAIQPFGAMIVLQNDDNGNSTVRQASENCPEIIGCSPEYLFSLPCFTNILDNDSRLKMRDILFDLAVVDDSDSDTSSDDTEKDKAQVFAVSGRGDVIVNDQYSDSDFSEESNHNKSWTCWCAVHKPELPQPLNHHYPPPEEIFGRQGIFIVEFEPIVSLKYPAHVDEVSKLPKEFDNRDAKPPESLDLNLSNSGKNPSSGTMGTGSTTAAQTSNSGTGGKTGTTKSSETLHAVRVDGDKHHMEEGQKDKEDKKQRQQTKMTHEASEADHGNTNVTIEDIRRSTTPHHKPLRTLARIRKAERTHETRQRVATLLESNNQANEDNEAAEKRRKAHRRAQARAKVQRSMNMPGSLSSLDIVGLLGEISEQLSSVNDIQELFDVTVGLVKELTQFHRIMLYQFDPEYNGKVVAELVDWQRMKDLYHGLHFPASDIPAQARDLYKRNKVRQLYDRDQLTSRMVVREKIDLAYPLDMSNCSLRAMSPIHIKYLENMNVRASLSISIVAFGQLYGLVACHSSGDNGMRVTFPMLQVLKLLSDNISRNVERLAYTRRLQSRKLISTVPSKSNPSGYIASTAFDLLSIFDADYGILSIGDTMKILGEMDRNREVIAIGEFLRLQTFEQMVYTNNISKNFPDLAASSTVGSIAGILYIPLTTSGDDFICFLRKGEMSTVSWAGNPNKNNNIALQPRASFKKWSEQVLMSAKQWEDEQLETAGVLAVVYGKFIEIWRQKTELSKTSQLSRILISNASHEVRTPLNHIINYVELALEGNLDNETRDNLTRSRDASKSLLFTINDLLDLTKVDSGQEVLFNEPVHLKRLVSETVQEFHEEVQRRNLALKLNMSKIHSHVVSDHRKLRTILTSLISNAVKYNKENGEISVTLNEIDQEANRANIALIVQDNGIGIPKKKLENLFSGFEKVDLQLTDSNNSSETSDINLGLGLASCARAIEQLDGQLKCSSEPGKGSTFTVIIPFNLPDKNALESTSNTGSSDMSERSFRVRYRNKTGQTEAGTEQTGGGTPSTDELKTIGEDIQRSELESFVEALAPSGTPSKGRSLEASSAQNTAQDLNTSDTGRSGTKSASSKSSKHSKHSKQSKDSGGSARAQRSKKGRFQVQDSAYPIRAGPGHSSSIPQSDIHSMSEGMEGLKVAETETINSKSDIKEEETPHEEVHEAEPLNPEKPARIIYIDDDPINRNILKKKLSKGDSCTVDLANNGEAGAHATINDEQGFDVVLMDLMMPIKDGYESCRTIREAEKENKLKKRNWHHINGRLPIFAVSASISPSHHDALRDCGFDAFFTKPINFDLLNNRLIAGLTDKEKYLSGIYSEDSKESFEKGGFLSRL